MAHTREHLVSSISTENKFQDAAGYIKLRTPNWLIRPKMVLNLSGADSDYKYQHIMHSWKGPRLRGGTQMRNYILEIFIRKLNPSKGLKITCGAYAE